ncbi:hypothetical protein PYW07_001115 [Mythimna separata]|uniref:Reverse transcriptase domain-containing protein n=1 Tax=Mythimna separata TaxID=271217 RepID=A0AAD8DWG8_MYTSE|nr:hypothetical protein PYW07_001115 [Mythimna separata]
MPIWSEAIGKHGKVLAICLDILKTFDRVCHESLITLLLTFGLSAGFYAWIADFLSYRSIRVVIDGTGSSVITRTEPSRQRRVLFQARLKEMSANCRGLVGRKTLGTRIFRKVSTKE